MKRYFVYIITNKLNGTLYIGSTSNLVQRTWQHKMHHLNGFSAKYDLHLLVYYEEHQSSIEMIRRERRLKNWCRQWKIELISQRNPTWRDLYDEVCK